MAGKPYSMREMKGIVDYLKERKAYGEVKGRKMWMEFASSRLIDRTWQSLKETFLKRILPDIQNPYYKLTIHEIRSFRMGCDVVAKDQNKLEIVKENHNSNVSGLKKPYQEDSSACNRNDAENGSGEDNNPSKIQQRNRDSVDTVKIRSNSDAETVEESQVQSRLSAKDCIVYDEPLTPALEQVLYDFATSSEDENTLKIVEPHKSNRKSSLNSPLILDLDPENSDRDKADDKQKPDLDIEEPKNKEIRKSPRNRSTEAMTNPNKATSIFEKKVKNRNSSKTTETPITGQSNNHTPDSFLPNNQEGLIYNDSKNITLCISENIPKRVLRNKDVSSDDIHINVKTSPKPKKNLRKQSSSSETSLDKIKQRKRRRNNVENSSVETSRRKLLEQNSVAESVNKNNSTVSDYQLPAQTSDLTQSCVEDFVSKRTTEIITTAQVHAVDKQDVQIDTENYLKSPLKQEAIKSNQKTLLTKLQETENCVENIRENKLIEDKNDNHNSSKENHDPLDAVKESDSISSQKVNPCLESVSLYAEQLSQTRYNSEDSDAKETVIVETAAATEKPKNEKVNNLKAIIEKKSVPVGCDIETVENKLKPNHENSLKDVVLLKSRSESSDSEQHNANNKRLLITKSKERLLNNMFGFSGGPSHNRKRRLSASRRSTRSCRHVRGVHEEGSSSSEWTSESDSSFVSPPPRSRRRSNRRIRNPKSARLLCLRDEGGLVVLDGKHVYPVVRDERKSTKTLTYLPDSDEEDSFWKMKYVEEKKKAAELAKRLELAEEKSKKKQTPEIHDLTIDEGDTKKSSKDEKSSLLSDKVTIMFKTANKNVPEVQVEGKWQTLHHVVEDLRSMFVQEPEQAQDTRKSNSLVSDQTEFRSPRSKLSLKRNTKQSAKLQTLKTERTQSIEIISSGTTTPLDPKIDLAVHEKVTKLESEIFKKIEESEMQTDEQNDHVTVRRRGNPPRSATPSPAKKPESSDSQADEDTKALHFKRGETYPGVIPEEHAKSPSKTTDANETSFQGQETDKAKTRSLRIVSKSESINSAKNEQTDDEIKTKKGTRAKTQADAKTEQTLSKSSHDDVSTKTRSTRTASESDSKQSSASSKNFNTDKESRTPQRSRKAKLAVTSDSDSKSPRKRKAAIMSAAADSISLGAENVATTNGNAGKASKSDSKDEASSSKRKRLTNVAKKITESDNEMETPETSIDENSLPEEDSQLRYKFPSPPPDISTENNSTNDTKSNKYKPGDKIFSPENNLSRHSVESTQGYQDSDTSFIPIKEMRKKRKPLQTFNYKVGAKTKGLRKRRSYPIARTEFSDSSDSSRSISSLPVIKSLVVNNSSIMNTIDSYVYKSESYQHLMGKSNKVKTLEKINESNLETVEKGTVEIEINIATHNKDENISEVNIEAGHSSSVSLPWSPELSIVENISINKKAISSVDDYPSLNEIQANEEDKRSPEEKFAISSVDVTMPLMEQHCDIDKIPQVVITPSITQMRRSCSRTPKITVSALIDKIGNVDLDELTMSDSLHQGLRDLVLESAKKISRKAKTDLPVKEKEVKKQIASKKRCSTPHKRKSKKKQVEALVEAEHMEFCSNISSRKSYTDDIQTDETDNYSTSTDKSKQSINSNISKGKIKKDIIKVKIIRPVKSNERNINLENNLNVAVTSYANDTESGVFLQEADDSVDLIHNHSETCLHANDCINDDSVQIIERSRTVISLDSYSYHNDDSLPKDKDGLTCGEFFCTNAQDATVSQSSAGVVKDGTAALSHESETFQTESQAITVFHSPEDSPNISQAKNSLTSLITEDLSDESNESPPRSSKLYLHSDEETTNTNFPENLRTLVHSNLQKIFPLACAVPDLSTITENSQDSRKTEFVEDGSKNSPGFVDMNLI